MGIRVIHAYTSSIKELSNSGSAGGAVGPSEWNADHVIIGNLSTGPSAVNIVSGTSYIFLTSDAESYTLFTSSSAISATVPVNVFPVGTQLTAEQGGTGVITFVPAAGVTFNPTGGRGSLTQYAVVGLFQKTLNVWTFTGSFT